MQCPQINYTELQDRDAQNRALVPSSFINFTIKPNFLEFCTILWRLVFFMWSKLSSFLIINLVSFNHGLTKTHVVWAYPLVYIINCGFLFVCLSVTDHIWYYSEGAHVHLERWKHCSKDTRLNMVCTQ